MKQWCNFQIVEKGGGLPKFPRKISMEGYNLYTKFESHTRVL